LNDIEDIEQEDADIDNIWLPVDISLHNVLLVLHSLPKGAHTQCPKHVCASHLLTNPNIPPYNRSNCAWTMALDNPTCK